MSNTPPPQGFPLGQGPQMPWPPAPPMPRQPPRWPTFVTLAITLVAVAAAVAAWLRPPVEAKSAPPSAQTFSEQQIADAKAKVCAAYWKVLHAITVNAARNGGDDPNNQLLVALAQRGVYDTGSAYLTAALTDEPATPADLAAATKRLVDLFRVINLDGSVGDRNDPAHDAATQTGFTIQNLCK